jgi:holin-like protein
LYKLLKETGQVALLCGLSVLSNLLAERLQLPLPGSIVGIFILFFLLQCKIIRIEWVELGANLLLAELLLFFIPSAVGIVQYQNLLIKNGLPLLFVIIAGTVIVMALTGLFAAKITLQGAKRKRNDCF